MAFPLNTVRARLDWQSRWSVRCTTGRRPRKDVIVAELVDAGAVHEQLRQAAAAGRGDGRRQRGRAGKLFACPLRPRATVVAGLRDDRVDFLMKVLLLLLLMLLMMQHVCLVVLLQMLLLHGTFPRGDHQCRHAVHDGFRLVHVRRGGGRRTGTFLVMMVRGNGRSRALVLHMHLLLLLLLLMLIAADTQRVHRLEPRLVRVAIQTVVAVLRQSAR